MIIDYKCSNYKAFAYEAGFSFRRNTRFKSVDGPNDQYNNILVFGRHQTGKTCLASSLMNLVDIVKGNTPEWDVQFDINKLTTYQITFEDEYHTVYVYSLSHDLNGVIRHESLSYQDEDVKRATKLYDVNAYSDASYICRPMQTFKKDFSERSCFLSKVNNLPPFGDKTEFSRLRSAREFFDSIILFDNSLPKPELILNDLQEKGGICWFPKRTVVNGNVYFNHDHCTLPYERESLSVKYVYNCLTAIQSKSIVIFDDFAYPLDLESKKLLLEYVQRHSHQAIILTSDASLLSLDLFNRDQIYVVICDNLPFKDGDRHTFSIGDIKNIRANDSVKDVDNLVCDIMNQLCLEQMKNTKGE